MTDLPKKLARPPSPQLIKNDWPQKINFSTSFGIHVVATVSKNFKINLEGQNYVHFYVILSRNVKIFGIMASL